jgi:glycosyltransferase involved in cell wall biosynthesis
LNQEKLLILSNCADVEYLGSGYIIHHFKKQLQQYYIVDYYDARTYELFSFFAGRASLFRLAVGKLLLLIQLLIFKKKQYQIIEFWGGDSFLAMWFAKSFYKKILLVHHSNGLESKYMPIMDELKQKKWYHFNYNFFYNNTITLPHGIVTLTQHEANWLKQNYPQKNAIGINPCLAKSILNMPTNFTNKKNIICYVGTWLPKKGIQLLISDMPKVLQQHPQFVLRLIGVGNAAEILPQFAKAIQHQIEVIPFVKEKNVLQQLYAEAKILVLPSIAESFGMVTLEAMAAGCAIVATKMGLAADLVENEEVVWIANHQQGALHKVLNPLLFNGKQIASMGNNNYKKAQLSNWQQAGFQLHQIYSNWYKQYCSA